MQQPEIPALSPRPGPTGHYDVSELQFSRESLASVRASNVEELLVQHWQEIAHYQDIALEVDWPKYELVEAAGKLRIFTARIADQLVGYAAYVVDLNPHYRRSLQAIQDALYLAPEYRNARVGHQLVAFADLRLAAEGVQVTYQHSKVAHPIDAVIKPQGYELIETVWGKRLDRPVQGDAQP